MSKFRQVVVFMMAAMFMMAAAGFAAPTVKLKVATPAHAGILGGKAVLAAKGINPRS